MCENHTVDEPFWLRKLMLLAYGKWVDDTLDYYLFLGKMSRVPLIGGIVGFFANQYGKYLQGGRAATTDECLQVLAGARQITVMDCACRVKHGNCDNSVRTCIGINTGAEVLGDLRKEQPVSKDEAVRIIRESAENGLIRSITHCVTPNHYVICNCCTCCCVPYRLRDEFGIKSAVANGFYVPRINKETCRSCGRCVNVCPQDAICLENGSVNLDKCMGCGLCYDNCPYGAINVVHSENNKASLMPGRAGRFIMYAAFLVVILPLAVGYKILHIKK